jgi:hypothetical protein
MRQNQIPREFSEIGENRQLFIAIVMQSLLLFNHSPKFEYQIFSFIKGLFDFK